MDGGHFCQYSNWSSFSNIRCLLKRFFAWNTYNVLVMSFLVCFVQFYFFAQTHDFAKAIAHGWRPFLPIFKVVSFFKYPVFFKAVFCME